MSLLGVKSLTIIGLRSTNMLPVSPSLAKPALVSLGLTGTGLCLPCRFARSKEVKLFYSPDGDFDPPNQDVLDRFKRLRWGAFIHARSGRRKHLYRRTEAARAKLGEHILTNRATSFLLDNMLNKQHRKPRFYPEDIYEPYHKRWGVPWDYVQHKPKFFP